MEGNGNQTAMVDELRRRLEEERRQLAEAVEQAREAAGGLAAAPASFLRERLPLLAGGAFAVSFVLAGGIGASMRLLARRGREGHEKVRIGPVALVDRR
jgi:hypothetical protein